jgi:replication factor C subunit 1
LSGPPGIGKTSAARIVCAQLGFEVVEQNASDTRNKSSIESSIKDLSTNKGIDYFSVAGKKKAQANQNTDAEIWGGLATNKSVIIMDEVDGVGAGDRGGIAALIKIIKATKTPIICICNDRSSQKLASLVNHCYDLKFQRPPINQIKNLVMRVAKNENFEMEEEQASQMIESSGNDIR